ncbi:MAG: hypothetical protein GY849_10250 [Deltaproteobacteria bacterium]|nr:hypothetical protein [Deltaproteobacteria bacterium]
MRILLMIAALFFLTAAEQGLAQRHAAPNEVIIFDQTDYAGGSKSIKLERGMRHKLAPVLGDWDDQISSVMVGSNVSVALFQHADFMGKYKVSETDLETIGRVGNTDMDDQTSSLIVFPRPPWGQELPDGVLLRAYHPKWYLKGRRAFFPLPENEAEHRALYPYVGDRINDRSQVISTDGPVEAVLYEQPDFRGKSLVFSPKQGPYELSEHKFDKMASSLIVRSKGWKAGAPSLSQRPSSPPTRKHDSPKATADDKVASMPARPTLPSRPLAREIKPRMTTEFKTNRPGMDYRHFDLKEPLPELCREACADDERCRAYTYVRPGIQGALAHCRLKSGAPAPEQVSWYCVSGVKKEFEVAVPFSHDLLPERAPKEPLLSRKTEEEKPRMTMEFKTNRPGMDYRHFELKEPLPELCREACADDERCRAYTYVRPGIQGALAHCRLKSGAPAPEQVSWYCVSGVKRMP